MATDQAIIRPMLLTGRPRETVKILTRYKKQKAKYILLQISKKNPPGERETHVNSQTD